jgi:hypothetical protein
MRFNSDWRTSTIPDLLPLAVLRVRAVFDQTSLASRAVTGFALRPVIIPFDKADRLQQSGVGSGRMEI